MTPNKEGRPGRESEATQVAFGGAETSIDDTPDKNGDAWRTRRDKFAYVKLLAGRSDLTHAEYRALVSVWNYTDAAGRCAHPGPLRIGRDMGNLTAEHATRTLRSLVRKGYLHVTRPGGTTTNGGANEYELALPDRASTPGPGT